MESFLTECKISERLDDFQRFVKISGDFGRFPDSLGFMHLNHIKMHIHWNRSVISRADHLLSVSLNGWFDNW